MRDGNHWLPAKTKLFTNDFYRESATPLLVCPIDLFIYIYIYIYSLFIYGCAGSLWLHVFSSCDKEGLLQLPRGGLWLQSLLLLRARALGLVECLLS